MAGIYNNRYFKINKKGMSMKMKRLLLNLFILVFALKLDAIPDLIPTLSRVYNERFTGEVSPQELGASGTLDGTFNDTAGSIGSINVNHFYSVSAQAKAIVALSNGDFLVALSSDGLNSGIEKYSAAGILQTSTYNSPHGLVNLGSNTPVVQTMMVDVQGRVLVAGGDDTNPGLTGWLKRISVDGLSMVSFTGDIQWQFIAGLAEQSTGNIITVGSNGTNAQIARYLANGTLDPIFGNSGYALFNGLSLPSSNFGIYSVAVDAENRIYVPYVNASNNVLIARLTSNGSLDMSWGTSGSVALTYLNGATPSSVRMAVDNQGDLIVGAEVSTHIRVTGVTSTGGAISDFTNYSTAATGLGLSSLITTNDGSILVSGFDTSPVRMVIIKLVGAGSVNAGNLDTTFNGTGYNFFQITGGSVTQANIFDFSLAPDGRIYAAGFQEQSGTLYPYVSRLYNTLYDTQVSQSPATAQQGILDFTFGQNNNQTYSGVVTPYLGSYRANLQQQATSVIEVAYSMQSIHTGIGDLLVGMNGLSNESNTQSMMLTWLTPAGLLDTNFGNGTGQIILQNYTDSDESFSAIAQGSSGAIYVAGTSESGAILRKYDAASTSGWTNGLGDWQVVDTRNDYHTQGIGIALQGTSLVLLFENYDGSTGSIAAYDTTTGHLANGTSGAPTFGDSGQGYIYNNSFGLNVGPLSGGVVNAAGDIFVAYQNSSTYDNVVAFKSDGSGLITEFGTNGQVQNIFDGSDHDIHIAAANTGDLLVCGVNSNFIDVIRLDGVTGQVDPTFNEGQVLSISLPGASVTQLQGISDGSMIIIGSYNTQMFVARVTSSGSLDTTFNAQGTIPGIEFIAIGGSAIDSQAAVANAVTIQSSSDNVGNIIIAGYEQATSQDATPMVMRLFGQPGTTAVKNHPTIDQYPGTLDLSLNGTGYQDLASLIASGSANVVFAYPADNDYEGMLLIGVDNGTTTIIARVDETYMTLDTTFGNPIEGSQVGIYTVQPNLRGINCLSIDANNYILIGGTSGDSGWAQQLTPNGTSGISFDLPSNVTQVNAIGQQKSGRYIVAGQNIYTQNIMFAFQNQLVNDNELLQLDLTFNPLGYNSPIGTFIADIVSGGIYNLVINSDDTILVASNSEFGVQIAKIMANGSALVSGFGDEGSGIVLTLLPIAITSTIRLVIDNSGNIIVAAIYLNNSSVAQVVRYTSSGVLDNTWNPLEGVGQVTTITGLGSALTLTSLLETATQQTILLGCNESDSPNGYLFAARLTSTGILDSSWNPNGTDATGIVTFDTPGAFIMGNQAWIGINGNIWTTSYGEGYPTLIEIVGDTYVQQVAQDPLASPAGTLDYTLDPSGSLNLTDQLGFNFNSPATLSILSDQSMIMGWSTEGIFITKLNPLLKLDTSFNALASGFPIPGSIYLDVHPPINDLFIADGVGDTGAIYITGSNSGSSMWAAQISADGSTVNSLTAPNSLVVGGAICKIPTGNILVAGYDGSTGIVAAFVPDMTALDLRFGDAGYYTTNDNSTIYAMTIDDSGRIYIAYKNFDLQTLIVQRILADGSGIDMDFSSGTPCCFEQQVAIALDQVNHQLVTANVYNLGGRGVIYIHRYNTITGASTGGDISINIGGESLTLSSLFIDTNQNIYVVGYSAGTGRTIVSRIIGSNPTSISFDSSYAATSETLGTANLIAGQMTGTSNFYIAAGILDQDGRVYVVGADDSGDSYMARLFGDNYYTELSPAVPLAGPATFDATYGVDGIDSISAGIPASAGQQALAILPIAIGTNIMTVVANADGTQAWTVRQLPDGSNDATYTQGGSGNGVAIAQIGTGLEYVEGMVFDGSGNSIVFGGNTVNGGFVKSILPSGIMNPVFGGISPNPTGTTYLSQFIVINAVAQLSNGNFVCVGINNSNVGTFAVLDQNGQLIAASIQSFGTNIKSVSIDSSDNMYLAVGSGSNASVIKLNAAGALVSEYSANNVLTNVYNATTIRLVLNSAGNVVVAASINGDTGLVQLVGLTSTGSIDPDFNQLSIPFALNTNAVVTSLVALQNGNILVAGYQFDPINSNNADYEFVASVRSNGQLDTTFNPGGSLPGLLTFQVASGQQEMRNIWNMNIQYDGRILLAGSEESLSSVTTPSTIRLDGYPGVKAIQQFIGAEPVVPSLLNPVFNGTGIGFTSVIANLVDGGSTIVDSQGRVVIGGRTSNNLLVVARFLPNGILDTSFNGTGITQTPTISTLSRGSFVALDSSDNVYIGAITSDRTFIVAKFIALNGNLNTAQFNSGGVGSLGIPGIAQSNTVSNLNNGGYVSIDYLGNVLVGGSTLDSQIAVSRFSSAGIIDGDFGTAGIAQSGVIVDLLDGGYVTTEQSSLFIEDANNVYLGGATTANSLVVVKFDNTGNLADFGTDGIAQTSAIPGLIDGGPIALDGNFKIIVGGFTTNKVFVAARFLSTGSADHAFNGGIAYSNALSSLNSCTSICIDINDNVLLGGISTAYDGVSKSMVIARMTRLGAIDPSLSKSGIASTGIIDGLVSGGFVGSNLLGSPFVGGYAGTKLVVAEIYSGAEIFINNPQSLPLAQFATYWYGNSIELFKNYLGYEVYAQFITDTTVRNNLLTLLNDSLNSYAAIYAGQSNLNLVASTTPGWDGQFLKLQLFLIATHPGSAVQINEFFSMFNARRIAIHNQLASVGSQL